MNKKEYNAPEILVEEFNTEEIMTDSGLVEVDYSPFDVDVDWKPFEWNSGF